MKENLENTLQIIFTKTFLEPSNFRISFKTRAFFVGMKLFLGSTYLEKAILQNLKRRSELHMMNYVVKRIFLRPKAANEFIRKWHFFDQMGMASFEMML